MADWVAAVTDEVFTGNVMVLSPALIARVAGTVALVLELVMSTVTVPVGTAPSSTTVAVDVAPPSTVVGDRLSELSASATTLTFDVLVTPP